MAFYPGINMIAIAQLRASLALVLPMNDVDATTSGLPENIDLDEHHDQLARAIHSAQFRLLKQRLLRHLPSRNTDDRPQEGGLLSKLRERDTDDGIYLALHVGAGLTIAQIADLLDRSVDEIADTIAVARLALSGQTSQPCHEWRTQLGAYRDGRIDRALTASIAHHRATCETCRDTLGAFEQIDDELIRETNRLAQSDAVQHPDRSVLKRRLIAVMPIALVIGVIAATVMVTAGLAGNFVTSSPTSLYASDPVNSRGEQGWIIYGTWDGGLHAFDPVSGTREVLLPEYYTAHIQDGANYLVSPDGERVAIFAQADVAGLHWATRRVRFTSITGDEINEIEWQHALESGWPTGWLGNDELLIASIPVYEGGETTERFLERLEAEGQLRAVDIESGEQRTIYNGAVAQVIPSPDASRLAIVRPRDPAYPGTTVELWSVEDGVASERLGSVEHSFTWTGGLLWSKESDALYLGQIAEFEDQRAETSRDDAFRGQITSINLVRIDRDGDVEPVTDPAQSTGTQVIGISDDGEQVVYTEFPMPRGNGPHEFVKLDLSDGTATTLELPDDELQFRPTHSGTLGYPNGFAAQPDGAPFMLHLGSSHYLRVDPAQHYGDPPRAIYLTMFDEHLEPSVSTVISDRWPLTPLGWLPQDAIALPDLPDIDHASEFDPPIPVGEIRPYAQLGGDSTASPDGAALPMVEALDDGERPYLWFPLVETGRWIASQTSDLTWHGSSHAFLGVTQLGGNDGGMSRISQHSASQRGGSSIDGFFDPLSLHEQDDIRYAAPAASPNATRTSFFTVDSDNRRVSIWMAEWLEDTSEVHAYDLREGYLDVIEPLSVWLDDSSLLFVEPLTWSRDVPTTIALQRLSMTTSGEFEIETLIELSASGRDRGIDIVDLAIQPGGEYIAWRMRHYADSSDPDSGTDSIQIATTANLQDAVEIDRAEMASGLAWSPGGQALAIGSGNRIGVYAVDTHNFAHVSDTDQMASHPAWLSDRELWFNAGPEDNAEVFRVRFGD